MSNLVEFAEQELDAIGVGDPDADYNGILKTAVLDIIRVFSEQGHSGASAAMVTAMVEKLMRYEPLTPLTGAPDEWCELDGHGDDLAAQNKRCFHVFRRADGTAYDIDARVFRSPDGDTYSGGRHGHTDITFPYTPTVEYVDVDEHGEPIEVES
jgi:hypothetical protein